MKKYYDTMYGFVAEATSKQMAWMLIRNKCHELKKEVPTIDKIIIQCEHKNVTREDGLDECLDCGTRNY